jgi:hypothetical protein
MSLNEEKTMNIHIRNYFCFRYFFSYSNMGLFGSGGNSLDKAKEKVSEITTKLRQESRQLDRQIRS